MPGGREGLAGPSQQPARPAPLIPSSAVEEQNEEGIWAEVSQAESTQVTVQVGYLDSHAAPG